MRKQVTVCPGHIWTTFYYAGDQINKAEMGGACGTYGLVEKCVQGFGWETWGKEITWENLVVDGRIILQWILEKYDGDADWINLAQDKDRCRAVVNTVMNFRVS